MLGISLARDVFEGIAISKRKNDLIADHKNVYEYMESLKENGIESIEFRTLAYDTKVESYLEVLNLIWEIGFNLTVHIQNSDKYIGNSFLDIYPSASYIIENFRKHQKELILVVHALNSEVFEESQLYDGTVKTLKNWSEAIDRDNLPIKVALENNRKKDIIDPGNSTEGVLNMVKDIASPNVGIVWDMGHFYSNILVSRGLKEPPKEHIKVLPSSDFLKNVIHTHIHGLIGNITHHTLAKYESLPLEFYIDALRKNNYKGIYNLELSPERFPSKIKSSEGIYSSISRLKKIVK